MGTGAWLTQSPLSSPHVHFPTPMSIRTDRVARMIQREVADLLQQDFGEATQSLTTVTGARITPDLGTAYIDVSVFGATEAARQAGFAAPRDADCRDPDGARRPDPAPGPPHPGAQVFPRRGTAALAQMDDVFARIRADREARGVVGRARGGG